MKQRLIQQVGRSARLKVINELKRSQGRSVGDLAERLHMSYMGVKGICSDLERRGLLDTWRQPQERGRPQILYRLTERAHDLFPTTSNELTLQLLAAAQRLFGPAAAEKLLLVIFKEKTEGYVERLKDPERMARAEALARLRDREGHMAEFSTRADGSCAIIEHHSPLLDVLRAFPIVAKLETEMFQRILGAVVRREEASGSGPFCVMYTIADAGGG
jgi:predicted ArsR family transcriptional regulator